MVNYTKLIYEEKNSERQTTNNKIQYYIIKQKYKPIEELYDNITTNLHIYKIAEKYNSIAIDILAIYKNVMWLDADGSMHTDAAKLLIEKYFTTGSVIIGSRFKDGGGYKGVQNLNDQSIIKAIKNAY